MKCEVNDYGDGGYNVELIAEDAAEAGLLVSMSLNGKRSSFSMSSNVSCRGVSASLYMDRAKDWVSTVRRNGT